MYLFIRVISKILAIPMTFFILFISPLVRIRFIKLFSSRIGHYSVNTEIILCALDMNLGSEHRCKAFFYISPREPICNTQLHQMWKRTIPILPFSSIIAQVDCFLLRFGGEKYKNYPIKKLQEGCEDRYNLLEKVKKCHLIFTQQEEKRGRALMKELGLPEEAPFVCLLVRDSNYLNTYMPSIDWSYHVFRDAEINSYQLASTYLAEKGYYVIRMGKFVKEPFFVNNPKVIDYAASHLRSDFMDIYLSARCFFYISTCTGLDSVARVFRKPMVVTNLVLVDFDIWHPWKLFIPKKIMDINKNKILNCKEMKELYFQMRLKKKIPQLLQEKNLRYIDNSPEEIKDVVVEMLEQLTGSFENLEEDEWLQQKFWQNYPKYQTEEDFQPLDIPISREIKVRVGAAFLRNNRSLLTDSDALQVNAI